MLQNEWTTLKNSTHFNDLLEIDFIYRHEYFDVRLMLTRTSPPLKLIEIKTGEGILVRGMKGEFVPTGTLATPVSKKEKIQPPLLLPPSPVAFLKPKKWDYL